MEVPRQIFKAYDIRGIYPSELNETVAERVGKALVTLLKNKFPEAIARKEVVVATDGRISGPALKAALVESLVDSGVNVIDVGMISTDMLYFASAQFDAPAIMVSASHNPKEWNGFKMIAKLPNFISGKDLEETFFEGNFETLSKSRGAVRKEDLWDAYVEKILSFIDPNEMRPLTIVADTANGMGGPVMEKVFSRLPMVRVVPLYFDVDGNFPNHGADPLQEENRRDIIARVKSEHADMGFAFDGDADRFFCIDDTGYFVPGDFLTAILGREVAKRHNNAAIVYDVRASWAVPETITAAGGRALMNRVGHAFIKARMAKEDAIFGGEVTGHYYFKNYFYADSGIIPALLVLALVSKEGKKLSDIVRPYRDKYFISGEINSKVKDSGRVLEAIEKKYADAKIHHLDGVSVDYPEWHCNVRTSNTEPLVRLNLEAKTQRQMEEKRDELLALIRAE